MENKLSPRDRMRVAVAADADIRSVRAYLAAKPMRSLTRARIARALVQLGFAALVRPEDLASVEPRQP